MRGCPRARQSLLAQRPDAATPVADLARERDGAHVPIRGGSGDDELVAWRVDGGWAQTVVPVKGDTDGWLTYVALKMLPAS